MHYLSSTLHESMGTGSDQPEKRASVGMLPKIARLRHTYSPCHIKLVHDAINLVCGGYPSSKMAPLDDRRIFTRSCIVGVCIYMEILCAAHSCLAKPNYAAATGFGA